jgi:type VI secretion system protein ImpH
LGATGGQSDASLTERLRTAPARFEFVQALRLLEAAARAAAEYAPQTHINPLGLDHPPGSEIALLRTALELAFPAAEVARISESDGRPEISVTFMGLNGVSGMLPAFYSQLLLDAQREKNTAPRDFMDIFNHRALSFFLRAAQKYRLPLCYEHAGREGVDPITSALLALVGLHGTALRGRQGVLDEAFVFYAGHFARTPPTVSALEQILGGHFGRPMRVLQFRGRWVDLPLHEQTCLIEHGRYAMLGSDSVLGSRVWDVQGSFRIRLGALDYAQFQSFMPGGARMVELVALTRTYVGPALSFDVQLILTGAEVPPFVLSAEATEGPQLGWNTWLPAGPMRADADDAVFATEALEN